MSVVPEGPTHDFYQVRVPQGQQPGTYTGAAVVSSSAGDVGAGDDAGGSDGHRLDHDLLGEFARM